MDARILKCAKESNNGNSGANNTHPPENGGVPVEDREDAVLAFYAEHGIALPPKALYRGMKVQHGITFSYRTVQNILSRLNDDGYVLRCDKNALDEGRIERVPDDENQRRTYYFITEKGRERIADD